jgi:hypothetical protein
VAEEEVLGPPHAHIGLQRQPAQPREHTRPAPAAEFVPDEVHRKRHHRDRADHEQKTDASLRREGPDREEDRDSREWNAHLLRDDQDRPG